MSRKCAGADVKSHDACDMEDERFMEAENIFLKAKKWTVGKM